MASTPGSGLADRTAVPLEDTDGRLRTRRSLRAGAPRLQGLSGRALALVLGALALAVRAVNVDSAYEMHIDEVTYARIADAVARTGSVDLYGEPFFLHPPLVFLLEGGLLRLLGLDGAAVEVVLGLRLVPVVAAAVTAALLVLLVLRVTSSRAAAAAAGLLFALDPFVVRQTSRNLLEAPALLWVVAAVAAAAMLVPHGDEPVRRRWTWELATGVCAGLALLTKEPTAFVVVLPLLVAAITGWSLPRLPALRAVVVAGLVYLVYPVTTLLVGRGDAFAEEKLSGVLRLVGARQETGFNAGRGPSLLDAVLANLPAFAPTYALLLLSAPAVLVLLLRGGPAERWLATWTGCAQVLMAYLVVAGTLEEQFFSYLVVPSIAATCAAVVVLRRRSPRLRRPALVGAVVALLLFAGVAGPAWAQAHLQRHDGYAQALAALRAVAPCGATVSATAEPLPFLLQGYRIVEVKDLVGPRQDPLDYVLTASKQVADGFGAADAPTLAYLEGTAERVFTSPPSDGAGEVVVWRMPGAPGGSCERRDAGEGAQSG